MSKFYYETQRIEDIESLQAMFGPPWTGHLLGAVLDFYEGDVDRAVNKLLTLNEHHHGDPTSLVERLLLSGATTQQHVPTTAEVLRARGGEGGSGVAQSVPKSKRKAAPPPRQSKLNVTLADDPSKSATITIQKQTRRRIGTIQKLPKDFLRIPKKKQVPLFNPMTLDKLNNMPKDLLPSRRPQKPQRSRNNSKNNRRASAPLVESGNNQQQPSSAFQILRSSINFTSFPSSTKSSSSDATSGNKGKPRRTFFAQGQENRERSRSSDSNDSPTNNNSILGNFTMPKMTMTAPTITMPKVQVPQLPSLKKQQPAEPSSSAKQTIQQKSQQQLKAAPPGPPGPPMFMFDATRNSASPPPPPMAAASPPQPNNDNDDFAGANEDGHWFPGGSANANHHPVQVMTTSENDLLGVSFTLPPPPEAAPEAAPEKPGGKLSFASLGSLTTGSCKNAVNGTNQSSSKWSFSSSSAFTFSKKGSDSPPPQESAPPLQDKNKPTSRWQTFTSMGSSLTSSVSASTTSANSGNGVAGTNETRTMEETYGNIPQVEFRGVSLKQLQQLVENMRHHCVMEQWKSVDTGRGLQPKMVTMYDLVKHYIIPQTQGNSCSFVEQAHGKHHYDHGLPRPPQWFVSHTWSDTVIDLVRCIEQHAQDRGLDEDDTVKYWISALSVNQHQLGANVVADLDTLSDDSILQDPRMTQRVLAVTQQGMLCVVDKWDRYFTRMWCLWEFFLALEREKACFESGDDRYLLDVYTINDNNGDGGVPVGLTDGPAQVDQFRESTSSKDSGDSTSSRNGGQVCNPVEWSELRLYRQSQFRYESCFEALGVQLESARTSLFDDSRRIMNCIVQYKGINPETLESSQEAEALTLHPAYGHVNALIQGTFAGKLYRLALESAETGGEQSVEQLKQIQASLLASNLRNLEVSFAGCKDFQIREALKFVESLPSSLNRLDLDYSFLDFRVSEEFAIGFSRLAPNLQALKLNFAFCTKLENMDRLWEELGGCTELRELTLAVHPNKAVTSVDGLTSALNKMPKLERLELEFDCFGEYSKMVARAKGGAAVNSVSSIFRSSDTSGQTKELTERFDQMSRLANSEMNGAHIDDSSIDRLCRSIRSRAFDTKIKTLKLRFLGDLGKKLKDVQNVDDLAETLQSIRNGLKLFS